MGAILESGALECHANVTRSRVGRAGFAWHVPRIMADNVALTLEAAGFYAVAGFVFALAFLSIGIARLDPAARGSGLGFRLMILPGVMVLWPLLLVHWIVGGRAPDGKTGDS